MPVDAPQHDDLVVTLLKDEHVGEPTEEHAAHVAVNTRVERRHLHRAAGRGADRVQELRAEAGPLRLVPYRCLRDLLLGLGPRDRRAGGPPLDQWSPRASSSRF